MEPASEIPSLKLSPDQICIPQPGPTNRWLAAKQKWNVKYAKQKRRVQLAWAREYAEALERGFLGGDLAGEMPPPSALAGRPNVQIAKERSHVRIGKKTKNMAGWMWGKMAGKEDSEREAGQ